MGRCTVCTSALWLASSCTASSATKRKEPAEKVRAVPTCLAEMPPPPPPCPWAAVKVGSDVRAAEEGSVVKKMERSR